MKKIFIYAGLLIITSFNIYPSSLGSLYYNVPVNIFFNNYKSVFDDNNEEAEYKLSLGKNLEVNLIDGGSIKIIGWDKESVKVLCKGGINKCNVKVEETSDGLKISQDIIFKRHHNHGGFVLEVYAPGKVNLQLQTNGGDILLDKIEGEIGGKTMGGDLNLNNLKGNISLETMGGDISLKNSFVDGIVSTMGGDVVIADVVGEIKGKSMGGDVSYKNITNKKGESTGKQIIISTMGGDLNVDDAPAGADVHTMGGDIIIRSAKKFVKAKTMGGEIKVDEVDGWIEATTMGGDISVNLLNTLKDEKHDVNLKSLGGDVTLYIPENFPMDVDITLAFTKDHEGDVDIISDFNLTKETTKEWDRSNGSARKYIYGKAQLNGSGNKVIIETVNGNIYLKKGK
jgi:hypothetical protein